MAVVADFIESALSTIIEAYRGSNWIVSEATPMDGFGGIVGGVRYETKKYGLSRMVWGGPVTHDISDWREPGEEHIQFKHWYGFYANDVSYSYNLGPERYKRQLEDMRSFLEESASYKDVASGMVPIPVGTGALLIGYAYEVSETRVIIYDGVEYLLFAGRFTFSPYYRVKDNYWSIVYSLDLPQVIERSVDFKPVISRYYEEMYRLILDTPTRQVYEKRAAET